MYDAPPAEVAVREITGKAGAFAHGKPAYLGLRETRTKKDAERVRAFSDAITDALASEAFSVEAIIHATTKKVRDALPDAHTQNESDNMLDRENMLLGILQKIFAAFTQSSITDARLQELIAALQTSTFLSPLFNDPANKRWRTEDLARLPDYFAAHRKPPATQP